MNWSRLIDLFECQWPINKIIFRCLQLIINGIMNQPRRITFLALDMGFERDAWRKVLVDSANDYTSGGWWVPLFLAYNDKKNGVQFTMSSCLFQ